MTVDLQNPARAFNILDRDIPTLPHLAVQAMDMLKNPSITSEDFEDLILQDHDFDLARRVLHAANASAGWMHTRRIKDAVVRLGLNKLYNIVMVAAMEKLYDEKDAAMRPMWNHAVATGVIGYYLANNLEVMRVDEVFTAGLLHDIGKWIVHRKYPELYVNGGREADGGQQRLCRTEAERFPQLAHAAVGATALRRWNLSQTVIDSARLHHLLEDEIPPDEDDPIVPCIVSLASAIANNLGLNRRVCQWEEISSLACARRLNFETKNMDCIVDRLCEVFDLHPAA